MITTARQLKDLIRNLSKKKSADAQILMRNYMMERFLERISLSEYKNQFILKGGMLVAAMVGLDARATMDLDATIKGTNVSVEDVEMIISQIISIPLDDGVSFRVKRISEIMEEADYPGVRVSMETKFDGVITPLKIDISTGDVITPTNGAVYYDGKDIRELGEVYRSKFGFLPQDFGYHRDFTVKDYLEYMAALKDIPTRATTQKINHLLDILSLSDVKKKKISNLSGGMKRRVGIAQAMLNDPEILVMDEPTAGLDPGERVRLRNFISEFSHDRIVLISTHIVSDIEYISTRNAIMKAGEIVDVGTTAELVKRIEGKVWNCIIPTSKLPECEMRLRIINQRGEDYNQVSIRYLSEHSEIDGSVTTEPRLEDLYLWLFPQTDLEKEER